MSTIAIMRDIQDFGPIECPEQPRFARRLAHALIHDYVTYQLGSGRRLPATLEELEGYVCVVMESVEGFAGLNDNRRGHLLGEGVTYLMRVMDETERFLGQASRIAIPYQQDERTNLLMVV